MADAPHMADRRLTLRLSRDVDRTMRESAEFFGRSVGAEWRAAAEVYRRVLKLWSQAEAGGADDLLAEHDAREARRELLTQLCKGVVRPPARVDDLLAALEAGGETP